MQVTDVRRVHGWIRALPTVTGDIVSILIASGVLFLLVGIAGSVALLDPLRLIIGLAYVFVFPGYSISTALFPQSEDLTRIERAGLSIGLSIAIVPVLALILDRFSWGLHLWPIMVAQLVTILVFAFIGGYRRAQTAETPSSPASAVRQLESWWASTPSYRKHGYGLMIGAMLTGVIAVSWVLMVPAPASYTTEFYMLGPNGLAESFPRELVVGQESSVLLGTANRERTRAHYRVEVWVQDEWDANTRQQLIATDTFALNPGQTQEVPMIWSMPTVGADQRIDIQLFIDDRPNPYRELRLFMNVLSDAPR